MDFINEAHRRFYESHSDITARGEDFKAIVYTLGVNRECRDHFAALYNEQTRCIVPSGLHAGWQTGASLRITRLAFNLFTHSVLEEENAEDYTPKAILSGLDADNHDGALLALMYFT